MEAYSISSYPGAMSYGSVNPQFDFSQMTFPDQGEQGQTLFCGPGSDGFLSGMSSYAAPAQHHHPVTNQQVSAGVQSHLQNTITEYRAVLNEPVTMRTQNYPPETPLLTQMENRIAALQVRVDAANKSAATATATAHMVQEVQATTQAASWKAKLKRDAKKARIQVLVQTKMRWALGIGARDVDGKVVDALPHPLKPREEAEFLADEKTRKTHPDWSEGVSNTENLRFCIRMKDLVMEKVKIDNALADPLLGDPSDITVLNQAKVFFKTLRKKYNIQTTDEGRTRDRKKRQQNKQRSRKKEKADDHRLAIPKFREIHGAENTIGDYDAVQTDDMSSEHSDCGKASENKFNAHRRAAGGGEHGWELDLYFAHLKTIRRGMLAENHAAGLPENVNHLAPPPVCKKPLYESMVSNAWMEKTNSTYMQIGATADPEALTLFKLKLDTTGLHNADKQYLADNEA
ncbi:hypothetical protein DFH09DRAFT_1459566 [Mycena vulgaris]|nr:hypothetical protein DFH09DRAFT_1459566 [Mycena vulgaris]